MTRRWGEQAQEILATKAATKDGSGGEAWKGGDSWLSKFFARTREIEAGSLASGVNTTCPMRHDEGTSTAAFDTKVLPI